MKICFASNNAHKLEEIKNLIDGNVIHILSLQDIHCMDELPETQDTLEGNALQKAQYVFQKFNVPCFADDTGLEVDVLQGAPGVYSARYAGKQRSSDDNIDLLLSKLQNERERAAQFRTVIALVGLKDQPVFFEGIVHGQIISERRGSVGFGYDPIFMPQGYTTTFAEMSMEEKNSISHRALAVRKLCSYLNPMVRG